ncbi:transcriptional regulator [Halobacteriales archaeon QH_7_69_31]|nr:MAG: transcriptional regulator [Halobacteriales archaeon QH_7_69_31]
MSRGALVGNVTSMLADAGFAVSDRCAIRPKSFDIAARRGDDVVLLKVLANVDAFDGSTGAEMRRLGEYLEATPLVIGLRTRNEDLKPGVVYFRHGVPVLSPDTALDLFVEAVPPLIYAAPGGLYVNVDGDLLSEVRSDREWSLGKLASELGVSRRTVSKYEDGMSASVDVAAELEEIFDRPLASPVSVFDGAEGVRDDVEEPEEPDADPDDAHLITILTRVGFTVHPTSRAPFEAISEDQEGEGKVLTGHSEFDRTAEKRARIMSSVGHITRTRSVYVVDSARRDSVEGTALIEHDEVEDLDDTDELDAIIRERSEAEA